jgi:HK97 family phage major capsid protein
MNAREIRFKINQLLTEQQKIALAGFTPESRAKFDKIQAEVDSLDAAAQIEDRLAEGRSFDRSPRGDGKGFNVSGDERRDAINKAFRQYALTGRIENRDLVTTSDTTGGALIPQEFLGVLIEAQKFYGPIASKVKQKVTDNNGRPMKISYANDTSNGLTLLSTEGSSSPAETDPAFVSKILGVDTVTGGLVKVSFQELEDSNFNLDTWLRDAFSIRYARGIESAVTKGVDSAGTTLPNQATGGLLATATAGTTTAALADGIGWDDLTAAYGALDPAYIVNASWVMNSATRAYLLGLKDGFGRPYFQPNPSTSEPFAFLMGLPVVLCQSMPNMAASAKPILLGDLEASYLLRTDGAPSILRLNERYADSLEVAFFLWSRIGGTSLNAGVSPLVYIEQASS